MQAQAYEGYFESGKFYTAGKALLIPERRKVYITIIDEPIQDDSDVVSLGWLEDLHNLLRESGNEKLCMEDFPRMEFRRETIAFNEE